MVGERAWGWHAHDRGWPRCRHGRMVEVSVTICVSDSSNLNGFHRWSTKHPLHLSSEYSGSATSSPTPANVIPTGQDLRSSVSVSPESPIDSSILHSRMMSASAVPVIVDRPTSFAEPNSSGDSLNESFTTAFAMLLYNVCYLAYTQSVDIPLSQAGDALSNLWAVCCSNDLGRSAHLALFLGGLKHVFTSFQQAFTCNDPYSPPADPADLPP